ncbi:MAG: hypothetical protein ACKPAJ_06320, partial [Actinomycetota bacterium]
GSQVADATANGIENQLETFVSAAISGNFENLPDGHASAKSTNIGHAVTNAAKSAKRVTV